MGAQKTTEVDDVLLTDCLRLAREWKNAPRDCCGAILDSEFVDQVNEMLGGEVLDSHGYLIVDKGSHNPDRSHWPTDATGRLGYYAARIFTGACKWHELRRKETIEKQRQAGPPSKASTRPAAGSAGQKKRKPAQRRKSVKC